MSTPITEFDTYQKRFTELYFQTCRVQDIKGVPEKILNTLLPPILSSPFTKQYPDLIRSFIMHTRSIEKGKGEWDLAYYFLYNWYLSGEADAVYKCLFDMPEKGGSYKDWKLFAGYVVRESKNIRHPLILKCIQYINDRIAYDIDRMDTGEVITHMCKWVPRENNKYSWLFYLLAKDWTTRTIPSYFTKVSTAERPKMAIDKCCMVYRKQISKLSQYDKKTPSSLNRHLELGGFIERATQIIEKIHKLCDKKEKMESSEYYMQLLWLNQENFYLQHSWNECMYNIPNMNMNKNWGDGILPIVDYSITMMEKNEWHAFNAIGLACMIAYNTTKEKRRVMIMDHQPSWINLSDCNHLLEMVENIIYDSRGNTIANFDNAFSIIKDACVNSNTPPSQIVVLSNMDWIHSSPFTSLKDGLLGNIRITLWKIGHSSGDNYLKEYISSPIFDYSNISFFSGINPRLFSYVLERRLDSTYESILHIITSQ